MALVTPTELSTALGIGTLVDTAILQEVCDAADNALLPFIWANTTFNVAHSNTATTGTLYFSNSILHTFYVGQTVVISGNGSKHNGSKTLTAVDDRTITYAITGNNNVVTPYHPVNPLGTVAAESYLDPATVPAIQEAALMVAISIYQARQSPANQSVSYDGYTPSPFTMSATLIARVRGLIAPYLDPRSQVG